MPRVQVTSQEETRPCCRSRGCMHPLDNTPERYGTVAVALHWLAAVLIVGMSLAPGSTCRAAGRGLRQEEDHAHPLSQGIWPSSSPPWLYASHGAGAGHCRVSSPLLTGRRSRRASPTCAFYVFVCSPCRSRAGLDVLGGRDPGVLLRIRFPPDLIHRSDRLFRAFVAMHKWLAYAMMAALVAHVGAALWHALVMHDTTLRRMLPARPRAR